MSKEEKGTAGCDLYSTSGMSWRVGCRASESSVCIYIALWHARDNTQTYQRLLPLQEYVTRSRLRLYASMGVFHN